MTGQVAGFRLSRQQQRLWRLAEAGLPGRAQLLLEIDGGLDEPRLRGALLRVAGRHETLRTRYRQAPGVRTVLQVVDEVDPAWEFLDLTGREPEVDAAAEEQRGRPVGTGDGPVLRAMLCRIASTRWQLLLTLPALAADTRALRLLAAELVAAYQGRPLTEGVLQYSQFAEWQHQMLDQPAAVAEPAPAAELPFALRRRHRAAVRSQAEAVLPLELVESVAEFADRREVSREAVLLAGWQALLARVTGQSEVVVGTALSGREFEETADSIGHFAHWAAVAARTTPELPFETLVSRAERALGEAEAGDPSDGPAQDSWDVCFEYQEVAQLLSSDPEFTVRWAAADSARHALKLDCEAGDRWILTRWQAQDGQFDQAYLHCLAEQYAALLTELLRRPAAGLATIVLPGAVAEAAASPGTAAGHCLHELVARQARSTPQAVAVAAGDIHLTYQRLDELTDRWARLLRSLGVGPESRVAVAIEHRAELPVALLAVLKAGGAYLPLDPDLPARRAGELLTRADCRLLLTATEGGPWGEGLAPAEVQSLRIDLDGPTPAEPATPPVRVRPDQLAYLMYTSGSTGAPKGVLLPHRAVSHYLLQARDRYPAGDSLVHSSIAFDLTVTSLFLPLISGRTVRLDPDWRKPMALADRLESGPSGGVLKLTPSHLQLLNARTGASAAHAVDCLVVGGEALTGEAVRAWLPATRVFNEYGPTETAVGCCVHEVGPEDGQGPVPIGRPLDGIALHVLDERLRPAAVGVPGELYVGGPALARGYLDQPGPTSARFIADPSPGRPGERLYRTGDLVCLAPDGLLHYLGRTDQQVKIRGTRIEPEEIRAALLEHPEIRDAAVRPTPQGDRLAAYLVAEPGPLTTPDALRGFLGSRLPALLVPSHYRLLDALPLTPNGKLDTAALPPADGATGPGRESVAPRDETERLVADTFRDLLGGEPVGAFDDFFALGGHSLLAVQLVARLNTAFDTGLSVSVLFAEPSAGAESGPATVAHLARLLRANAAAPTGSLVPLRTEGTRAPVFCVHPAGGEVAGFRDLAALPGLDRPVYALQSPLSQEQSVESLAEHYLSAIRPARPAGPYVLLGWSMGGLVAFEMARRLEQQGEPPALLVLLESYLAEQLPAEDDESADAAVLDQLAGPGRPRPVLAALPEPERRDLTDRLRLNRTHLHAARTYRPPTGPPRSPILLLQATEQPAALRTAALATWRRVAEPAEHHLVPGAHLTVLRPAGAAEVARIIETALGDGPA
ncbi:amino acid adenylation domain-containing protein [Kitasatospora sp. NPDC006697]|uniref:non-ribosomal peptide synthetase n=1 Tax=Kitasatospora sp. NPDC006697 TaxID=3364020 RepID=UPI0036A538FB